MSLTLSLVKELRFGIWIAEFCSLGQLSCDCYFALEVNWSYCIDQCPLFSSNTHSCYGAYVFIEISCYSFYYWLWKVKPSWFCTWDQENTCAFSLLTPGKAWACIRKTKDHFFFFIDRIGLVLVLNTVTKWGKPAICNLILFFCLLILLRICLWNIGQEQNTSTTIIVRETGENCLYLPNVTSRSEFWCYFYLSFSPLDWHPWGQGQGLIYLSLCPTQNTVSDP